MSDAEGRSRTVFRFKRFSVSNEASAQKVGTDGVIVGAAACAPSPSEIWDVGAGTGLIALMLAQRYQRARITAVEIESIAASECRDNVAASPWSDRITVVEGNINNVAPMLRKPDMMVSNPPFFTASGCRPVDSRRATARQDGSLSPISLISLAYQYLASSGRLIFIAPYDRNDSILFAVEFQRMTPVVILDIATRSDREPKRRLWTIMRKEEVESGTVLKERIDIHALAPGTPYTDEYRKLTGDFYLDF